MGKMLKRLIGEDVELVTHLDPHLHPVLADPAQVDQVIMNLVINARDAMPRGGRIVISTSNVQSCLEEGQSWHDARPLHYVLMAINDNGCGMDEATRARIFEPFFTTKEQNKGTGLGLATVYGIVKQSGGHVSVESKPGVGTTFRVYLPPADGTALSDRAPSASPSRVPGHGTILLVEDEDLVRRMVRDSLKERGYTVLEAPHAEAALEVARRHPGTIHLLLTDIVMPGANGVELSQRFLAARPGAGVLYMSGYTDDTRFRLGLESSAVNYLQKPFGLEQLLNKVSEVLRRGVEAPPRDGPG
jgi:CheY-like chemotaxis protein